MQDFGGGATPEGGITPTYYFAKNCMKMKEFGPRGGVSLEPLWIHRWAFVYRIFTLSPLFIFFIYKKQELNAFKKTWIHSQEFE